MSLSISPSAARDVRRLSERRNSTRRTRQVEHDFKLQQDAASQSPEGSKRSRKPAKCLPKQTRMLVCQSSNNLVSRNVVVVRVHGTFARDSGIESNSMYCQECTERSPGSYQVIVWFAQMNLRWTSSCLTCLSNHCQNFGLFPRDIAYTSHKSTALRKEVSGSPRGTNSWAT